MHIFTFAFISGRTDCYIYLIEPVTEQHSFIYLFIKNNARAKKSPATSTYGVAEDQAPRTKSACMVYRYSLPMTPTLSTLY